MPIQGFFLPLLINSPTVLSCWLELNILATCCDACASYSSSIHGQTSGDKASMGLTVSILSRTTYQRSLFVSYLCQRRLRTRP